jgi:iron complex transport system substrate-binding protein
VIRAFALLTLCLSLHGCSEKQPATPTSDVATRVVTFAPHLAEILFVIGAGDQLVGVSAWSDFPREVLDLPEVGDAFTVDQEQLSLLRPDLVLVWESGMPVHTVDELRGLGYRVESVRTRGLDDVVAAILRVGELTGRDEEAATAAAEFTRAFDQLRIEYRDASPIDVFFQISARPLYTINREHFISEIIAACGGQNIFDDLSGFAPSVDIEAVLERDPEVLLAGANLGDDAFVDWARWPQLSANRYGNQFLLPDETIGRPSPRLVLAGRSVCMALDRARRNREAAH